MSDNVFETPHTSCTNDPSVYNGVSLTLSNEDTIKAQCVEMPEDETDKKYVELNMMNYTLIRCGNETDSSRSPEYTLVAEAADSVGEDLSHGETVYILNEPVTVEEEQPATIDNYLNEVEPKSQEVYIEYEQDLSESDITTEPSLLAKVIHEESPPIVPRKRRSALPPPHVLLASPDFRLYLYSCRLCHFKCNAIKELSQHKKTHIGTKPTKTWKKSEDTARSTRSSQATELLQRIKHGHHSADLNKKYGAPPLAVDCLKCALCGFETSDISIFKRHSLQHKKDSK